MASKGSRKGMGNATAGTKRPSSVKKPTPVIEWGAYKGIGLGTHLWTQTDIQCPWCQGWEGMGPLLWYNLSWSSHNSPLFTIPADVATPHEQEFAFSGVVGSLPLRYGSNVCQSPPPNEPSDAGQPLCLRGSSLLLLSVDNQLREDSTHRRALLLVW